MMLRGGEGLYLLPKNVTMKGENYMDVLHDHLLPFMEIYGQHTFMHDLAHLIEAVLNPSEVGPYFTHLPVGRGFSVVP